jgi:L-ascorbate metabolism protein UlaG (beta-lactamase superfamily)
MNHGGSWDFEFGNVKYVNAIHTSSFPDGSYGGQPGGFVIEGEHKNIYIAGDTALTMDMKLIPMRTKLDLAILPIGSNFTMDVEDAIIASDFVECDKILGYHYDTFGYIEINHEEAKRKFFQKGKDLMLLEIGQSIDL